ncbi:MAG TPA: 2-C-methyl-D-erythritol 4-phosphate cytidylyltransferase [Acidimicrobiales bacterium]|nr:2-C-methyl-D-erythritol 4-phosphate cytidylyltransferase [Acidimicrobiales bacterium]
MSVWAVVVAAGSGTRFGGFKQYELLGHRTVVDWAVAASRSVAAGVVLAVPPNRPPRGEEEVDAVVVGGATRSSSVRAGLAALPPEADVVVIHDAARPLATPALFEAVVAAVRAGADGAVPGIPISDTVKRVRDGQVVATLDRAELVVVQTPQAFRADILRRAHLGEPEATDDAALVEAAGGRVVVVAGDADNLKLTAPEDLAGAEHRVNARRPGP